VTDKSRDTRPHPRVWTVEEANALVPRLTRLVGQQLLKASEIESRLKRLHGMGSSGLSAEELEAAPGDVEEVRQLKGELRERISLYEEGWREVQALGPVVKDPRVGLLDFYGRVDGKLVWLCWRYGEEAIEHYHDLDVGYSGRKPLTEDTRKRMLN